MVTSVGGATRPVWRCLAEAAAPAFAADALLGTGGRSGHAVLRALRSEADLAGPPEFAAAPLTETFGCSDVPHAFDQEPMSWTWLREPQITAGLAHFLQAGPARLRVERIRAFLAAAYECSGAMEMVNRINLAGISSAEAVAEEARVDLVVQACTAGQERLGVVIEAKFGHHLTPGQLPKARRHAATRGLRQDNSVFLVVLPHRTDAGTRILSRAANRGWRPVSWWALLAAFERGLPADADGECFRSLRHTIWSQTYGQTT